MDDISPFLHEVGARLRAERDRLGLSQGEFGSAGGVNRGSQAEYESGKRPCTVSYLHAVGAIGADAGWILTGQRSAHSISDEQAQLLGCYDAISDQERDALLTVAGALAGRVTRPRKSPPAHPDLSHIPPQALEEMFSALLDGIDPAETQDARAHLLAERLPIALSRLRDLQPVVPPVPASPPAPPSARVAEPAMPDRGRRS